MQSPNRMLRTMSFAAIALLIKRDSPGPVFFVQERIGRYGQKFPLLKFRTMHPNDRRPSEWVRDNGDRITVVGRWLRKYRLDEMPQLINVLQGHMNIIGPRPHPASNHDLFMDRIPFYAFRSMIRPGITGWAQVCYGYANCLEEETEKMRYDLYYIKYYSVWLDVEILLRTVKVILLGKETKRDSKTVDARAFDVATDSSRDERLTEFGKDTLRDRYLLPGETYQDLFARVASAYADDAGHAQRVYDYISKLWFMPATPVLSNGGTGRGLPISCYLNSVDDSLDGIVGTWNENVWLASKGGGIGTYWGSVRGIGEPVGLNGKTSGIIPFVRVMDSLTLAISQGSLRRVTEPTRRSGRSFPPPGMPDPSRSGWPNCSRPSEVGGA